jgi:hypothetical protein
MEIIDHNLIAQPGFGMMIVQPTDSFISIEGWIITVDDFGKPIDPIAEGLVNGVYLVGYDLEPGLYEVVPDFGAAPYWARLDNEMEIIDSETGSVTLEVTVEASDFAFEFFGALRRIPGGSASITTFDGDDLCTYEGPSEFALDTEATFTFVNSSDGTSAGYAVWKVPDGTTIADIEEKGIFGIGADSTTDRRVFAPPSSPGIDKEYVVALDDLGLWAVECFNFVDGREVEYPATVFVVTDS